MRDLEAEELKEYLEFCQTSDSQMPENWQPVGTVVHDLVTEAHLADLEKFEADVKEYGMHPALVAMWLTAFQCGREFETRHQEKEQLEGMVR